MTRTACTMLIAVFLVVPAIDVHASEFRAMWISRFEWPDSDPATCRATIDNAMAQLQASNFNAVFFQIRGQADTLYPSPDETWSPLIGGQDPGWDPLAYAIQSAHDHGIEFHAYINIHTCWRDGDHQPPEDPNHVFYSYCNLADPEAHEWLHHLGETGLVQFSESDYVWFSPGIPDFQAYVRKQVMYVVENYDVDGVHYDRIRTPWSGQPSYDPVSLVRQASSLSNPEGLSYTAWTADQITRTVRDIYAEIQSVKPEVVVSAAVYSNPSSAPTSVHQEALEWANSGGMDLLVPMMYFTGGNGSVWDTRLNQWVAGTSRYVVAGQITTQGIVSLIDQVALTRMRGGEGNSVFSIDTFDWWSHYLNDVYSSFASTPAMPWKDSPQDAVIYGYVRDVLGNPVVDAQITRDGTSYTALSSGDGFYSFLQVEPGTDIMLTASHPGYTSSNMTAVTVSAGDVVHCDMILGIPVPPVLEEVSPDPDWIQVGQYYRRQVNLLQGVATSWELLSAPEGVVLTSSGYVKNWTPSQPGTYEFSVRASNTMGQDDESWQVIVLEEPPCELFSIIDFEDFSPGSSAMFRVPRYSGSTVNNLRFSPSVAEVTDLDGFESDQSLVAQWEFVDGGTDRWMRLTSYLGVGVTNPTIPLDRPIRVRLQAAAGSFLVSLGIRETGSNADFGEDGGTAGTIEWVGPSSDDNGAPQGKLVLAQPGVWQTIVFDPLTDPVHPMNGDGILWTATGKGTLEHLAFASVGEGGPFTVYIDDIEILCDPPAYGDFNGDWEIDLADYAIFETCMAGPGSTLSTECLVTDADGDLDCDLADFAVFQDVFGS